MDTDMQAAFENFMLGEKNLRVSTSPRKNYHEDVEDSFSIRKKRGYLPNLRALQGRLEEWKGTNQKLEDVLRSIANLRDRIYWESQEQQKQRPPWKDSGFRYVLSNQSVCDNLLKEDVRLALNRDILQHERMLSALRSLAASLAQTVDEFGRRLEEWMIQNLMYENCRIEEKKHLELAQEVYLLLASDLYWMQKMAARLFDSYHANDSNSSSIVDTRNVMKNVLKDFKGSEHKKMVQKFVDSLLYIS